MWDYKSKLYQTSFEKSEKLHDIFERHSLFSRQYINIVMQDHECFKFLSIHSKGLIPISLALN